MRRPSFQLDKWYLDCVADDGRALIGYWASLRWGRVRLSYAAAIELGPGGVSQRTSLRRSPPPALDDAHLSWNHAALGIGFDAHAERRDSPRTLLAGENGSVEWDCAAPLMRARVRTPSATLEGLGYMERLTLTIKPWSLPIDELLWGRFTGDGASLVWIEWRGPRPLRLLIENGRELTLESVSRDLVTGSGGTRLSMRDHRIIRDGPLGGSVLRRAPLRWLAPRSMRHAHESKWLSRAALTGPDGRTHDGWAIHESVRFRSGS